MMEASVRKLFERYERFFMQALEGDMDMRGVASLYAPHFIAATRPGYDVAAFDAMPDVTVMRIPALAISSTDIRARVREGRPIRFLVPEGVEAHIRAAGLYR